MEEVVRDRKGQKGGRERKMAFYLQMHTKSSKCTSKPPLQNKYIWKMATAQLDPR